MKSKFIAAIITVTGFALVVLGITSISPPQLISPLPNTLAQSPSNPAHRDQPKNYLIYGFLPYWNVSSVQENSLRQITHLVYFSIEPESDGSIKIKQSTTKSELGWRWFNKASTQKLIQTSLSNQKDVHLVIKFFNSETITQLLSSQEATNHLIENLIEILQSHQLTGINIDYEPQTPLSEKTTTQFTNFLEELTHQLKSSLVDTTIVIDVIAKSGQLPHIYPLSQWQPFVDYFVIMTYDYHQASSSLSGPISPLYSDRPQTHSIIKNITQVSRQIPLNKIIVGIPFYGYQWQTTTNEHASQTYPQTGKMIPYRQIPKLIALTNTIEHWYPISLTPYLVETHNNHIYQTHFENPASISQKITLVTQSQLAGVAIWAIGYEGNQQDIWLPISQLNNPNTLPIQ